MSGRRYEQRLRAESAEATRRRILDALYERLRTAPTEPLSVEEIARAARVARSTVYLVFGSRAGLFQALGADLFERAGYERLVRAVSAPDARENLRGGIRTSTDMFAAHRDVFRVLYSMALLDAGVAAATVQDWEGRRAEGMSYLAGRLAEQGVLRAGVSAQDAAHVLWLLTSFDAFDQLLTGRRLTAGEVARILTETAERTLCR
jgi:AcrR family transcriptional regulator